MTLKQLGPVLDEARTGGGCVFSVQLASELGHELSVPDRWHQGRSVFSEQLGRSWTVISVGMNADWVYRGRSLLEMTGQQESARVAVAPFGADGPTYSIVAERLGGVREVLLHRHNSVQVGLFELDTQRVVRVAEDEHRSVLDKGLARSLVESGDVEGAGFVLFEAQSGPERTAWLQGLLRGCGLVVQDVPAIARLIALTNDDRIVSGARREFKQLRQLILGGTGSEQQRRALTIAELCAKCLHNLHVPSTIQSVDDTVFDRDTGWYLTPEVLAAADLATTETIRSAWLNALWA